MRTRCGLTWSNEPLTCTFAGDGNEAYGFLYLGV